MSEIITDSTELMIIVPVYNEARILRAFAEDWVAEMRRLGINFKCRMYNDGSTDESKKVIEELAADYREIELIDKKNTGHGPTIHKGYYESRQCPWVFQVDSDHELDIAAFKTLWQHRASFDLLIGERLQDGTTTFRKMLTSISSVWVRILFGNMIKDVNCPYRLIRNSVLQNELQLIPAKAFAPNILMSSLAVKKNWRIKIMPVQIKQQKTTAAFGYSATMFFGAVKTFADLFVMRTKV